MKTLVATYEKFKIKKKFNNKISRNNNSPQNNFNYSIYYKNKIAEKINILYKSLNLPNGTSTIKNICSKISIPMKINYRKN